MILADITSGKQLEEFVSRMLTDLGYLEVPSVRFFPLCRMKQPIYARQCGVGINIYGKKRRVDIILRHPQLHPKGLAVQFKWQASVGSVEEKYPFELLSIAERGIDTIIVLDGGGYSKGARRWLVGQVGKNFLKHVFDMKGLVDFAEQGKL